MSCPPCGYGRDLPDAAGKDLGTVCLRKQQDPARQYDQYPQEDREDPDGAELYRHDSESRLPYAGKLPEIRLLTAALRCGRVVWLYFL